MSNKESEGDAFAGVPRYVQIAEWLMARIEAGELKAGDRLPPERELSAQLGVTRVTVRQALQVLEMRGLLVRRQGAGTFVATPKIDRAADRLFPFTKGVRRQGLTPGAQPLLLELRSADQSLAKPFGLPLGAPVYYGRRLRLINQEPVMLEQFAMPAARFLDFERFDLASRSIYEIMESAYGVRIARARQSFEPVLATPYEAELLTIMPGAPLMLESRLTFDQDNHPIEFSKDLYRGDRFRFVTEIAPLDE